MPLYAVMTLATAGIRFRSDPFMAAAWIAQTLTALGATVGLLLRPKRADHVMRIASACCSSGCSCAYRTR